ncbi:MAG: hypothetical protein ACOCX0_00150 [Bacteroidota bacterium]
MKKSVVFLLLMVCFTLQNMAQTYRNNFRTNEASIELEELASPEVVFLFRKFQPAIIYYPTEKVEMNINYRLFQDEIISEAPGGETRALSTRRLFDSIVVNDMLLIYDKNYGYVEKVRTQEKTFFIKYQSLYTMNEITQGAYGQASPAASAESVNVLAGRESGNLISDRVTLENTTGNEVQVNIIFQPTMGLIEENQFEQISSRRDLNKLFPDHRSAIRSFLRKEKISFDERMDLIKLAKFLESL